MWKTIKLNPKYQINERGQIRSVKTGKIRKHVPSVIGYPEVKSSVSAVEFIYLTVHREVAKAFLPNPDNLPNIDHIDGDPSNCVLSNLRWCSQKENNTTYRDKSPRQTDYTRFYCTIDSLLKMGLSQRRIAKGFSIPYGVVRRRAAKLKS